jgi:hypothetical protein
MHREDDERKWNNILRDLGMRHCMTCGLIRMPVEEPKNHACSICMECGYFMCIGSSLPCVYLHSCDPYLRDWDLASEACPFCQTVPRVLLSRPRYLLIQRPRWPENEPSLGEEPVEDLDNLETEVANVLGLVGINTIHRDVSIVV